VQLHIAARIKPSSDAARLLKKEYINLRV